jgi:hypothetical protein
MGSDERHIFLVEFGDCDRRLLHLLARQQQLLRLPLLTSLFLFLSLLLVGVFHLLQQFLVCLHENWFLDLPLVYSKFLLTYVSVMLTRAKGVAVILKSTATSCGVPNSVGRGTVALACVREYLRLSCCGQCRARTRVPCLRCWRCEGSVRWEWWGR